MRRCRARKRRVIPPSAPRCWSSEAVNCPPFRCRHSRLGSRRALLIGVGANKSTDRRSGGRRRRHRNLAFSRHSLPRFGGPAGPLPKRVRGRDDLTGGVPLPIFPAACHPPAMLQDGEKRTEINGFSWISCL
jgi:hypothetical protein